jgi:hypothetical protein
MEKHSFKETYEIQERIVKNSPWHLNHNQPPYPLSTPPFRNSVVKDMGIPQSQLLI